MAYHDPDFLFVLYLVYVNMSIVNKDFFFFILSCTPVYGLGNFKKYFHEPRISNPYKFSRKTKKYFSLSFQNRKIDRHFF